MEYEVEPRTLTEAQQQVKRVSVWSMIGGTAAGIGVLGMYLPELIADIQFVSEQVAAVVGIAGVLVAIGAKWLGRFRGGS